MEMAAEGYPIFYSGLTLNQYGVASPCPDLKLIHYRITIIHYIDKGRLKTFQTTFAYGNALHHIQHINAQQIQALFQRVAGEFRQLQAAVAGCAF